MQHSIEAGAVKVGGLQTDVDAALPGQPGLKPSLGREGRPARHGSRISTPRRPRPTGATHELLHGSHQPSASAVSNISAIESWAPH
jgi:hypothetical protein